MDIVLRALVIFVLAWLMIRLSGKREMAELSAFDVVFLIVVGDLVAQAIVQEDYSITAAVIAVTTFAIASMIVARLAFFVPRLQPVLNGRPRAMILNGKVDHQAMRAERLTHAELNEAARQHGFQAFSEIEICILEADGNFAFFAASQAEEKKT